VIHSFWTPGLGSKRDLITNKTNYLWYTPDEKLTESAFNGFCTEYCGASHANMRFRVFTTSNENFESWAAGQRTPATGSPAALAARAAADSAARRAPRAAAGVVPAAAPAAPTAGYIYPAASMPSHTVPKVPIPAGLTFDDNLLASGDAAAGRAMLTNVANLGKAPCLTCHVIRGETNYVNDDQAKGPNLTHVGSRHTFGGGLFTTSGPNLARWIKNPPKMKPGAIMNVFGTGEVHPVTKATTSAGLSDKEIADIVAYLLSLK
jgi:cytochrome c oxidase subunit 2